MFDDEKEELKRLEEALLEEEPDEDFEEWEEDSDGDFEEWEEDPQELFDEEPYRPVTRASCYNADKSDPDLDQYAREVLEGPRSGVTGLTITALILSAAIVGVMIWFLLRYLI